MRTKRIGFSCLLASLFVCLFAWAFFFFFWKENSGNNLNENEIK